MNAMRMEGQLCDVTLITDCCTTFKAHSLVLAAGSDLFYMHFVQQQSTQHVISISDIPAEALKVTLDFIYGITPTEQYGFTLLLQGAQKIGIAGATRFCERKLLEMNGQRSGPPRVCPLKDADLIRRMLNKTDSTSPQSSMLVPKASYSAVHDKQFIIDLMAKLFEEVRSLHLCKSHPVPDSAWLPEIASSASESLSCPEEVSVTPQGLLSNRMSSESSDSFALTSDMNSDPGGMPMDIHHSLIPEMTLNDLTRAPECPHLKKLAANSGLVVSDEVMEGGQPELREMLPKKRRLNPIDDEASYDEPILTTEAPAQPDTAASSPLSPLVPDTPSPQVQHSDVSIEQSESSNESQYADDLSIPQCVIMIAPIDASASNASTEETTALEKTMQPQGPDSKQKGSKQYPCSDCSDVFASHSQHKVHALKHHNKGMLFACSDCDFKSPRKKDVQAHLLSKHKKAPPGLRIFKCKRCNYMCMDKNRYNEHMNCHSKDNPHKCTLCDKSYSTRRGLQTHLQYHSDERPHKCTQCDASFKVRDKLRDHIRLIHTHKGEKPFQCSYCTHSSALRGNCNQHIRKTHPGKPIIVTDTRKKDKSKSENAYSAIATLPADAQPT
eukprot:GHVO01047756.1.p1 GENE.GHVO01047756.1~~GHVO01047756.1.p1  ORF type:complete len:611 (+),score=61.79 GHVO01047756.1:2-1834(+)